MQTFLPSSSFARSARVLDRQRLGKQRVENVQILSAMAWGGRWASHPVTHMWAGYHGALQQYHTAICEEWVRRGYKDTRVEAWHEAMRSAVDQGRLAPQDEDAGMPPWLGQRWVHEQYRGILLRKDPEWYGQWGWKAEPRERLDYHRAITTMIKEHA